MDAPSFHTRLESSDMAPSGCRTVVTPMINIVWDLMRESNATYKFRLRLFDNETTSQAWMSFPKTVEVTKRIYAEIQLRPVENNIIDEDLLAIPRDCFFSVNSNPAADNDSHHLVLQSGCSVDKANAIVYRRENIQRSDLSNQQQQSPNTHGVRFSILIDSFFFPTRQFMFFHCQAAVCSLKENRSDRTIQMCPKNGFCTGDKTTSLNDDDANKDTKSATTPPVYANVFSGPLRPVSPRPSKTASSTANDDADRIPSWTIDGKRRPPPLYPKSSQAVNLKRFEQPRPAAQQQPCAPCPAAIADDFAAHHQQDDGGRQEYDSGFKIRGIDTLTVFCIATSSFLVGVLLMAGLCYVHKITEPKKFPNAATSCHKPLVDLQHRSLLSSSNNRFYPSGNNNNNSENTVSINCVGGGCCSDSGVAAAPPAYSANSVLLLAKPKLKLPCCYDPVDQNDESPIERRPAADGKRPLICDKIDQKS